MSEEIVNRVAKGLGKIQPGEDLRYMLKEYGLQIVPIDAPAESVLMSLPEYPFLRELEKRPMSSWTVEEMDRYNRLTEQI